MYKLAASILISGTFIIVALPVVFAQKATQLAPTSAKDCTKMGSLPQKQMLECSMARKWPAKK